MCQVIFNSIISASWIALVAIGFMLIFNTSRFFHFAHGVVFTAGTYFAFLFKMWLGCPLWIAILAGMLLAGFLGCLMEVVIYRPLRKRDSSGLVLLLASLGIYIFLQNIISMSFGDETRIIRTGVVKEGIDVLGARITPIQIVMICVSVVLVIVLSIFMKRTKIGKSMRAVANDPELASISGIASDRIIFWAFAIGSGLAGLAGILVALDVDMTPTMGMHALMMGIVAVIVGGVSSFPGIALAALLIGMAQHFGAWFIGSQWQDAIAFIILLVFLLFKPEGFLGKKVKAATV